jgi:Trypsin
VLRRLLSLSHGRAASLACSVLCACSAPASHEPDLSVAHGSIVFGEPSNAGAEDAVLLLRTMVDGQELLCTASLVAPNLALTARHCVARVTEGPFNCSVKGELYDNPTGAGRLGLDLSATSLDFYDGALPRTKPIAHGLSIVSTLSNTTCVNDIAFVVLDRAVALPVLPLRLHGSAALGEAVTLVGYGLVDDNAQTIVVRTQPRLRKTGLSIAGVGPASLADGVTTVPPRSLILKGPSGCVGDSGGPLLAASSNAVLGVYSLLNGVACSDARVRHQLVHVPAFQALTEQAFAAAGADPVPEARQDAGADAADAANTVDDASNADDASTADDASDADADDADDAGVPHTPGTSKSSGCAFLPARTQSSPSPSGLALLLALFCFRGRAARKRRERR